MLNRVAGFFVRIVERWMPDPFLFCLLLTALALGMALGLTSSGPLELVGHWYAGLWKILPFAMQMILILLTGYTLANSGPVRSLLGRIASIPSTQGSAIILLTLTALVSALINWGVALVASALLAREMARKVPGCDFGFLVSGAYSGFVIFGSGLSSSIALVSATAGSDLNFIARYTDIQSVPLSQTLFSAMNLTLVAGMLIGTAFMFRWMMPHGHQIREVDPGLLTEATEELEQTPDPLTPALRLERSSFALYFIVALGSTFLLWHFATKGFALDLNVVILIFLILGMALYGRPIAYVRAFNQAARVAGPLVLQYPLYGGIMGIMQGSGLAEVMSRWFVSVSSETTFPLFTFLSAVVVNLFIPSAGGQWAVQGPIMVPAGAELGIHPAVTAMAVAYGDQASNMLQPFWALPILAIAGLRIRDIMGYCVMTFFLSSALSILVLFFFR